MGFKIQSKLFAIICCFKLRIYFLHRLKVFFDFNGSGNSILLSNSNRHSMDYKTLENSGIARTNGEITFGDLLQIKFTNGSCDVGKMFFSMYTMSELSLICSSLQQN